MSEDVYSNLAKVLDTLPNGFPATESGVEIKLLMKIFRPEDAELFCDLRLKFETAQQVSERTGRPLEGLEEHLSEMREELRARYWSPLQPTAVSSMRCNAGTEVGRNTSVEDAGMPVPAAVGMMGTGYEGGQNRTGSVSRLFADEE